MEDRIKVRVFSDVSGYYFCSEEGPLWAIGRSYPTKVAACRAAIERIAEEGHTQVTLTGSGVTAQARKVGRKHGVTVRIEK